ncbi:glycosyltransferase family 2 protein [Rhodanobacter sp. C03]|uniref:glycosyltransferase family 2 protein n=1 Tax=Rhodanobacter sp. C03 TaxID=1945858 RepID=UPI0009CA19AB|nr:glycosyltransferase family 2 protein [Rhodanobacter sp. C03]OOG53668.1 family 2 glycosyl transferase [Rhodanobacter sp. C03]
MGVYIVFWLSALLLVHVFVGYPACVWWLAQVLPQRVRKLAAVTPTVTVVLAVYEGAEHIRTKLTNLLALDYPEGKLDIIVACDGCRDDTAVQCRQFSDSRIRVLEFAERRGKAACLNDAIASASGEVLLMTDVRQNLDPAALRELVANLADPAVGAVSGELRLQDALTNFAGGVDAYWRYEKLIRHAESRSGSTVGVTGAIYAMRRELFRPLPPGTVLDDVLIPMRIGASGQRVVFEPLALAWDRPSQQPAQERGRKIRTLAGNYQLIQLAPWLLLPWRNPLWWRFVSHKLLRLLAPWLMVSLALSSAALATRHAVCALTLLLLVGGVGVVALDRWLPAAGRLLPVRLIVAFWYLNLFAAQALIAFARNRRLHLW